jgi:hypothetical protein
MTKQEAMVFGVTLKESNPEFVNVSDPHASQAFWDGQAIYDTDALKLRSFIQAHPDMHPHLARGPKDNFLEIPVHGQVVYFEVHKQRWSDRQWNSEIMKEIINNHVH